MPFCHIHMFVFLACFYFVSHGIVDVLMNWNEIGHDIIEVLMWKFSSIDRKIMKSLEVTHVAAKIEIGPLSCTTQKHYC